jgi:hypothetical protein
MTLNPDQFAAEIYDQIVAEWPGGEMDFYREAAKGARSVLADRRGRRERHLHAQ